MPRKHDDLFDRIASFPALMAAANRAVRGKRRKAGAAAFMANLEREVLRLERQLNDGTYRPGRYTVIHVRDPKPRMVSAAPFRDRVVHHALCAEIEPIFERGFIFDSYANRAGKGTHRAVVRYEKFRDRFAHVLRCDIRRYFPAVDHEILKSDLRRRIACDRTLWLLETIIDASNPQEPVHIHYPGDGLFTPYERRRGLPIGNLTSQFFANVYLDGLDHFAKEILGAKGYVRYVDDFALFHDDRVVLESWRERIARYLTGRRLTLHPRKTGIAPAASPVEFLGYVLLPGGRRRLPEENVRRFQNRLRGMRDRWRAGTVAVDDIRCRIGAWISHAEHADTWRLRRFLFRGGMFDPASGTFFPDGRDGPEGKPGRPLVACASCAAVPGTTIRGTFVRPTATGTPPTTGTTTTGSVSPARTNARAAPFTDGAGAPACVQDRP
jgi:retron-type reverse transcriptase